MELYFLGTGAGMPTRKRNVTSIALDLSAERGTLWLFDCGEGTQHQILGSPIKLSKLEKIFISHLHGDHIFGLPGLLSSRSYQGGDTPLTLYGPQGIRSFIDTAMSVSESHLSYTVNVIEYESEGTLFADKDLQVDIARLEHRVESWGFRITESGEPGSLHHEKLRELGIRPGPIYGKLKQGEPVQLSDGRTLLGSDYVGPEIPGRIVTILGDTNKCEGALRLARNADVLVHEATFAQDLQEMAVKYGHSTSIDAATTAKAAGAAALIMTHLSSRYQEEGTASLLQEAKEIHQPAFIAEDFWRYTIPRKKFEER